MKDEQDFRLQIKNNIQGLTRKQLVFFSWLCAVRTLPLFGASGTFEPGSEKLMKYLYNILRSLDITFAAVESVRAATAADAAGAAIVADEADAVYGDETRLVVKIAAYAAYAAYVADTNPANTGTAIAVAADVAADICAEAYIAAKYHEIGFSAILLDDIEKIKANNYSSFHHDTNVYGPVWQNFQTNLRAWGCEYWRKLYTNIFESGFVISIDALERRVNIPAEIQKQGAEVVGLYLENLELHGSEWLNEARIIILGEKGAGKTSLALRMNDLAAPMPEKEESTDGVVITSWKIKNTRNAGNCVDTSNVNVHIWDFAGHVITHAAHRCFLSERCLYIIVYDGRTEERNRLNYWLEHVKNYGGEAPVRILVNMFDEHKPDIPENTLKEKYPYIKDFAYLSIGKDADKLKKFRAETAEFIQTNPMWNCLEIPANYYKVKEVLERRFQKGNKSFRNEHISKEVFDRIIEKYNIESENAERLLKALHELGICLWYHDIEEFNTLVLNPEWISHGIYSLINWAHNNARHMVSLNDYEIIFKNEKSRYCKNKLSFIFQLMKKYELAYSRESSDIITIPFLLREDQPENLPYFSVEDSLLIQYVAQQPLPPNTVSRLIVRHNENIRNNKEVWRYGVVLKYRENTIAMVKEDERKIIIKAKGKYKSEYIAKLRDTMNDIFNSYKGDKPELQYKIIINEPIVTAAYDKDEPPSLMLSDQTIKSYIANGRESYYYPQANMEIALERTANIYHINATNATFGANSQISNYIFNFNNSNLVLQGELRSLINSLKSNGFTDEAGNLENIASDIEKAENLETKKQVVKSGALSKLKNFLEDLGDENSSAFKIINSIKYGAKTVQSIAKTYNDIAQWAGLPQVPKPFLGGIG